jgi:predicted MFS family arabinose efflux permease
VIGADLGRAALLGLLPLLALAGALRMEHLYAVELLVGTLALAFDLALSAWYPSLVAPEHLVDGNSKLQLSGSTAQVAGPSVASALVQTIGAPLAILGDAASFLASAALISRIRAPERTRPPKAITPSIWSEMRDGVAFLVGQPVLRLLALCAALSNLFAYTQAAVLVLYVTRDLELPAGAFGIVLTAFGAGGIIGALLGGPAARRLGSGGAIAAGGILMAVGDVLVALAGQPLPLPWLALGQLLNGMGLPLFVVNAVALRQMLTPDYALGRVVATTRWLTWGALPFGSMLGGLLGEALGVHATLVVAAAGSSAVAALILCRGSLRAGALGMR